MLAQTGGGNNIYLNLPIGSIISAAIPLTDACFHLLDGSWISSDGIYADFYNYLYNKASEEGAMSAGDFLLGLSWLTNNSTFESDLNNTGNCGKFIINPREQTIRLPRITKYIQGLSSIDDIGTSLEAGLPNIEGRFGNDNSGFYLNAHFVATGPFSASISDWAGATQHTSSKSYVYDFDASKANSIYGKSNEVQTNSTQYPYYIVVANTINTDVAVDINKLANDFNTLSNRIENINAILSTRDYVVEQGENYIRLNSGKQICWGITTSLKTGKATIKLPISFINTEYIVFYSLHEESPTNTNATNMGQFSTTNRTTETFDTRDYVKQKVWLAIGKWK